MDTLLIEEPEILVSTGVVVQLSGTCTTTTTGGAQTTQGSSTTVWNQQPALHTPGAFEATVQAPPLPVEVVTSHIVELSDLVAVAEALFDPGAESYEQVRRELGLD